MENVPSWFFYAVIGGVLIIPAVRWTVRALGKQLAAEIITHQTPQIQQIAREEIGVVVDGKLEPIYVELRDNGGSSLKDVVTRSASDIKQIQHDIEPLVREYNSRRFDPPEGHPA